MTDIFTEAEPAQTHARAALSRVVRERKSDHRLMASPAALSLAKDVAAPAIRNQQASSRAALLADALVIMASSIFTGAVYHLAAFGHYGDLRDYVGTGLLVAAAFCGFIRLAESRQPMRASRSLHRAQEAVLAWCSAFILFLSVAFLLKFAETISRGAILSFFAFGFVVVVFSRVNTPVLLARMARSSAFANPSAILIGACGDARLANLASEIRLGGSLNPEIVTYNADCSVADWPRERQKLISAVLGRARQLGPGEIFISTASLSPERAESILRGLSLVPRSIMVIPDDFTSSLLRRRLSPIGEQVAVQVQRTPMNKTLRSVKRGTDIVLSSILILLLTPLFAAIALAVKWDSRGPVLFTQQRNGHRGTAFRIFKFRTMTVMEDGDAVVQVTKNDSRVTKLGAWLRKTSLDELPQLFNVLRGDMSLIGPRPHARAHDELYAKLIENYEIRQHVKPGITGWAQVNGLRGETRTVDLMYRRIEYDLWYAMNCNLWLDIQILARTALEVLRRRNAY